ncbi:alpha/beta fold hydrolase [Neobacillus sp. FSL H8-0543]|uniref:alpha/beta hydrolase n=1 Tax=Neobacillus sp. FSL H8-0543 TaxID=2954672 RepID=UPI0031597172
MEVDVRGKKKARGITLIVLAIFILLFSILSMFVVKVIYDGQFQRYDKPEVSGYLQYSNVDGYDRTTVEFESKENTLTGYLYGEGNEKGVVVIAHGLGEGAENYLAETMYFVDNGWRVFSFDGTGSHESEGEGTIGLPQSVIDLDAALTYIKSNNRLINLPIMLYGHSWGGYAVTAILNGNHDISAVASISGFNSPSEFLLEQADNMMGFFSYVEYPFLWIYQNMLFGRTARMTAVDGINNTDTAVLIIHGDKDESISYDGSSIIAHKGDITNHLAKTKTISEENHNGHNNLFVSDAASKYINKKNEEYKVLFERYNENIPKDIKAEFYEGVDKFKTSELDVEFMREINRFFEGSLSN